MVMPIEDELFAQILGWEILKYLQNNGELLLQFRQKVDSEALRILEKIQSVLNDDSLNDKDCFEHIEAIVKTFYDNNISTNRHGWG